MIKIIEKKNCCGCNACGDICPTQAIYFEADEEGFLYPKVDGTKCINCALCVKTCPQLHHAELKKNEYQEPKCYAAVHKNLYVLFDSTSGGAFSAVANVIYRQGGFVGGAIYNEDFSIRQYISDKRDDLSKLRSSKYSQSDARGFYSAVKIALQTGRQVLVCGSPCQIFALKAFLEEEYENLHTMDFICRGVNSPVVIRKYFDWLEEKYGGKIVYVKAKNKELGWRNLTGKYVFDNGKVVYDTRDRSYATKGYLTTNAYCRPSCYDCKFKGIPRVSDITVADFWGANKLKLSAELDRNLGTSLVMLNNSKGEKLFEQARKNMLVADLTFEQAKVGNEMIFSSLPAPKCNKDQFFKTIRKEGFSGVIDKFLNDAPSNRGKLKEWIKKWLKRQIKVLKKIRLSPGMWYRLFRYNSLVDIIGGRYLIFAYPGTQIECQGKIELGGDLILGKGYFKRPTSSTALAVKEGAVFRTHGEVGFSNGADIEVFKNAVLEMGGGNGFNIGATIICADRITIGEYVMGGRHVVIRDNNGGHYMNVPGYRNTKPVDIGVHAWLCEGCTIMSGVTIGAGAVIGSNSVVFSKVPANTMAVGNPAKIVSEDVQWKY